jgi:D-alanyl-D-alanine carboxypeptidase (penicillin-binding protein 5/6)
MKKILAVFMLTVLVLPLLAVNSRCAEYPLTVNAKSAILMEASSGTVLFEMNADQALPPASVTKIMTLLLVMEAIDSGKLSLDSQISASAHAASMGGSQVYLKEGESMSCEDMLKSVVVSSANDAAVALAEAVAGSEEAFVLKMNEKAAELGMKNTNFENTNGLDDTAANHVTSARDIAIMSRELINNHPLILKYSSIWMDTIRDGAFTLTNTNRLIRFYSGANGLKTGSTSRAKFCISATAERDGMQLIAVIMGSDTRDTRNEAAKSLLDFGFANYSIYKTEQTELAPLPLLGGESENCRIACDGVSFIVERGKANAVKAEYDMPKELTAPISQGEQIGQIIYTLDNRELGRAPIYSCESHERISFGKLLYNMLKKMAFSC